MINEGVILKTEASTLKKSKSIYSLDLFKYIAAIFVVGIHTAPLRSINGKLSDVSMLIFRTSVPFFFIAASYFFFKKINKKDNVFEYLKKYIIRLFILYSSYVFIYKFSYTIIHPESFKLYDFIKYFIIIGYPNQLWYLHGLLISMAMVTLADNYIKNRKIIYISALILYILGLLGNTYYSLICNSAPVKSIFDCYLSYFDNTRNGIFFGIPFVVFGLYISTKNNISEVKISRISLGLIISLAALFVEGILISKFIPNFQSREMYIAMPFVTYYIFLLAINLNYYVKNLNCNFYVLRNLSTLIYGFHMVCIDLAIENTFLKFIVICIISNLIGVIVIYLAKLPKLKFLKYLY